MINLSRNEIKTILTSFYLWKNTDFSHLDRKFQNKMRSGMKKVEDKLFKSFSELNDDDVEDWEDIVMVSAGDYVITGLKKDGTIISTN